jgi:hypothetical protein
MVWTPLRLFVGEDSEVSERFFVVVVRPSCLARLEHMIDGPECFAARVEPTRCWLLLFDTSGSPRSSSVCCDFSRFGEWSFLYFGRAGIVLGPLDYIFSIMKGRAAFTRGLGRPVWMLGCLPPGAPPEDYLAGIMWSKIFSTGEFANFAVLFLLSTFIFRLLLGRWGPLRCSVDGPSTAAEAGADLSCLWSLADLFSVFGKLMNSPRVYVEDSAGPPSGRPDVGRLGLHPSAGFFGLVTKHYVCDLLWARAASLMIYVFFLPWGSRHFFCEYVPSGAFLPVRCWDFVCAESAGSVALWAVSSYEQKSLLSSRVTGRLRVGCWAVTKSRAMSWGARRVLDSGFRGHCNA